MPEGFKICNRCAAEKPLSDFYSRANTRPKRTTDRVFSHRCKACDCEVAREYREKYTAEFDAMKLPAEKACTSCKQVKPAAAFAVSRSKKSGLQSMCQGCHRDSRYSLAPGQYDEMKVAQGGVCAICEKQCPREMDLSVDHCHRTGRVRGLLCQNCNAALGMLMDDPRLLSCAISYLN